MRDWLKRGLVLLVAMAAVITFERWHFRETIEGIVLRVDEGERVLLAQNLELDESDFKKSYMEWFLGDYDMIEVTNIEGVQSGMHVSVTFDGRNFSENALTVAAMDYEVLDVAFSVVDSSVPAAFTVQPDFELASIFPLEEGRLQVFSGRDNYAFIQRLSQVTETADDVQIYFEGYSNTGRDRQQGFNMMLQVSNDQVREFIRNYDSALGLGNEVLLHSIIERKTILKAPLEVGNNWTDLFNYEGNLYEAVTTIVRAEQNDEGKLEIETQTVVEGISGFANNRYEESRVFVQGSGMTRFLNSPQEGTNTLFTYGFSLITEKMD